MKENQLKGKGKWFKLTYERGVSLIALIVLIIATIINYYNLKTVAPEYALVNKDGRIILNKGFDKYGITITKADCAIARGDNKYIIPTYRLKFTKAPAYFEVTTQEGAIVSTNQNSINEYVLQFISPCYGNPSVESNFKIQAY